jgi:serine/threonine protein kinase
VLGQFNHRVSQVELDSKPHVLKIARFPHELRFMAREIEAYHTLTSQGSCLAPRLVGYVFEETCKSVVGFLCEFVHGRVAGINDLMSCFNVLRRLHVEDIIHGDIKRYSIFITSEGPKFVDFEYSTICSNQTSKSLDKAMQKEDDSQEGELTDESGKGRPWGSDGTS